MIRVAVLDLYEGFPNQGMRCIRDILQHFSLENNIGLEVEEFDVRQKLSVPNLNFDLYISTGGPGSPIASEGQTWDTLYFQWLSQLDEWNTNDAHFPKKHAFFICHSYQLACRYFKLANVCARKSTSFGVFPIHVLETAENEPIFSQLKNPFFAVDSRDFQVIEPNHKRFRQLGASILCIEKERPHVAFERAVMGIRFNKYLVGTQFHPEADAQGMSLHLQTEDRKKTVIDNYGQKKWQNMIEQLNDSEKILYTHDHVLYNFLKLAVKETLADIEPAV